MPISDCDVRDPRIRRTRQLLQGALGSLMRQKRFDEISVQDIAEAATVNRATFYDHYADKFQLLNAMVAGGFHQLLHERNVQFDGTCAYAASAIIHAACDYLVQNHAGNEACKTQSAFEPLIDSAMTKAIEHVLLRGLAGNDTGAASPPRMIAATASWAICGAVKQWFSDPKGRPAEEAVPSILQLVLPILLSGMSLDAHSESHSF